MEEHLLGEHTEFVEANTELTIRQRRQNKLNETEDSHEVVSELGDILWFLNAQATNGSVSFQDAWNFRLYRDRMNLTEDSARIKSVDDLIMKGYQPRMGVFELDDDPAVDLLFAAGFVCVGTKIIIEEHSEAGKYVELARTSIDIKKESMGLWLTHALGIITLHAQKNGASLSEVMQENMKKITLRAERKNLSKKASRQADEL
jgi:NTP pyrophosphatase (non-canonical NTP hydrolase)